MYIVVSIFNVFYPVLHNLVHRNSIIYVDVSSIYVKCDRRNIGTRKMVCFSCVQPISRQQHEFQASMRRILLIKNGVQLFYSFFGAKNDERNETHSHNIIKRTK